MVASKDQKTCIAGFFKEKGFSDEDIGRIFRRCKRLDNADRERACENWDYLKGIGIKERRLPHVVSTYPKVLILGLDDKLVPAVQCLSTLETKPGEAAMTLKKSGFSAQQIAVLITGYPPVLIKSIKNSLEPRLRFLVQVMGRGISEVIDYPEFFRHGVKKSLELREKLLKKQNNTRCSLREMLDCNQKNFVLKFGLLEGL